MNAAELSAELFASQRRIESWSEGTFLATSLARLVGRVGTRMARPPRVVLLGEFNSGKSTLANVLLGSGVLPTSIHANTRVPTLMRYADEPTLEVECADGCRMPISMDAIEQVTKGRARLLHLGLPVPLLKRFELIDTPGFADGMMRVQDLCMEACRRSHIAIWCTSATQAWKATEVATWAMVPQRLRLNSILVASHADLLNSDRDADRMRARLEVEGNPHFRKVVVVSSHEAEASRQGGAAADVELWRSSGGAALSRTLEELVDDEMTRRVGSAERLLARAANRLTVPAGATAQVVAA